MTTPLKLPSRRINPGIELFSLFPLPFLKSTKLKLLTEMTLINKSSSPHELATLLLWKKLIGFGVSKL